MDCDLAIVGGGPVGACLALAARDAGLHPVVLEARGPDGGSLDDRSLALAWSSCLRLDRLGVMLSDDTASPIRVIHVSQAGHPGRARLSAADAGIAVLGRVVGYGSLMQALTAAMRAGIDIRHHAGVHALEPRTDHVDVVTTAGTVRARVACIADGGGRLLADAGFGIRTKDYGVHALVARVEVQGAPADVAFERFVADGPLALLPRGRDFAVVWSLQEAAALHLAGAPEAEFLERLQAEFGWRAGRFTSVRGRATHPLTLRTTTPVTRERIAVVGNAAQTLHPVAGQGLNLGLRDAWTLAETLSAAPAAADPLAGFAARRARDRSRTIRFTDSLAELFRIDMPGAGGARAIGLTALDTLPWARRAFARAIAVDAGH